ncbi:MAG: riboflavin synthase subunit alpha [Desulfuromonadales bacterium GWD2_54_10]|nr:MAG: riboflavin synthase subunit alpha [Desulfuromonadales bacterium GWD2_54_10]
MFTGLIEDTGRVIAMERRGESGVVRIETALPLEEIALGDSLAVNGACLTVTAKRGTTLTFDVSPETITRTTFRTLRPISIVNLERALRMGERLGGHIVTGHIDCCATLAKTETRSGNRILEFSLPAENARYLVEKGSVTIDGISLTVNTVSIDRFSVNIIPHTLTKTTLADLKAGDEVNIETDIIGKYVERLVQPWKNSGGLSMKALAENGFI